MSDGHKPIQSPFDETVPDLEEENGTDALGKERVRQDIGIDEQEEPDTSGEERVREEIEAEREERERGRG